MAQKNVKNKGKREQVLTILLIGFVALYGLTEDLRITIASTVLIIAALIGLVYAFDRRKRKMLLGSGIYFIDTMSGVMFEDLLLEHFRQQGYRGKKTSLTGDYGADLVLTKDKMKYVVQAKRWEKNVGIGAVQEIVGAINHYGANKGMVITNRNFTKNAENLARSNNIELWNRQQLIKQLSLGRGREVAEALLSSEVYEKNRR